MRANEFLINEAALTGTSPDSWGNYLKALLTVGSISIGKTGTEAQDLQLTDNSKEIINNLLDQYESSSDKRAEGQRIRDIEVLYTDGVSRKIGKIFKSPEIKSASKAADTAAKKYWNDGEVAETFLGAALFTRFQSKDNISVGDVIDTIKRFKETTGGFIFNGHRNNDPIEMTALNKPQNNTVVIEYATNYADFSKKFAKGVKGLDTTMKACVSYVNQSPKVKEAINAADSNVESDRILIKTDGVSDQKGTKADLQLQVGSLQRLLSLKVNAVKQFGQNTGATPEVLTSFFGTFVTGIDLTALSQNWPDMSRKGLNALRQSGDIEQTFQTVYSLIGQAYQSANNILSKQLADPVASAQFIENLHKGIVHHAQGDAKGQTVVILNPKAGLAWQELEFGDELISALKSFRLETTVSVAGIDGENNHILKIYGRPIDSKAVVAMQSTISSAADATKAATAAKQSKVAQKVDPELLIQLRSYIQDVGPTIRNIIEMGPLLKDITDVEKINKVELPAGPAATPNTQELDRIKKLAGVDKAVVPAGKNTPTLKNNTFSSPKSIKQPDNFDAVQSAGAET